MGKKADQSYMWKVIILFFTGWAVIYADRTVLYPMLGIIGKDLNLTATQEGLITSIYFLFYVAMQVPAGILGDQILPEKNPGDHVYACRHQHAVYRDPSPKLSGIDPPGGPTCTGSGAYFPAAMGITLGTVPKECPGAKHRHRQLRHVPWPGLGAHQCRAAFSLFQQLADAFSHLVGSHHHRGCHLPAGLQDCRPEDREKSAPLHGSSKTRT